MATREELLSDPRSGAHPLGGSDPGPGEPRSYSRYSRSTSVPDGRSGSDGSRGSRGPSGSPGRSAPARSAPSRRSQSPARQVRRQYREHATTNYERVIVAEFIVAVVIVAAAPFTRKDNTGLSPYYGQDVLQLVAIMAAYFILGLVAQAGQGTARVAAWFGGLLVLGIGLGEAAYLAKVFNLFGAKQPAQATSSSEQGPQDAGAAPTQTGA
jgi:hypothetical protein